MILVDANLLLYAKLPTFRQHEAARQWLDDQFNGAAPVGLPWPSLLAFVRVATNPRIFQRPMPTKQAWHQVEQWLEQRTVRVPRETERHPQVLGQLLMGSGIKAKLVMDAHLAALAIQHGLILCSTDGDFARFKGLRWMDPLQPN